MDKNKDSYIVDFLLDKIFWNLIDFYNYLWYTIDIGVNIK